MFPVSFVLGSAIGSVATYVYKDDQAREWVVKTGKNLKEGSQSFIASFRKKVEESTTASQTAEANVDVVDAVAEKTEAAKK